MWLKLHGNGFHHKLSVISNFYTYWTKEAQPSWQNATYTSTYNSPAIQKMPLYRFFWNSKRKFSSKIWWTISGYQNILTYKEDKLALGNKLSSPYRLQNFYRDRRNSKWKKNHLMFPITEMQRLVYTYCVIFAQLLSNGTYNTMNHNGNYTISL
jgi:hypothetical protein